MLTLSSTNVATNCLKRKSRTIFSPPYFQLKLPPLFEKSVLISYFCFFNPGRSGLRKQLLRQRVSIVRRGGSRTRASIIRNFYFSNVNSASPFKRSSISAAFSPFDSATHQFPFSLLLRRPNRTVATRRRYVQRSSCHSLSTCET